MTSVSCSFLYISYARDSFHLRDFFSAFLLSAAAALTSSRQSVHP